MSYRLKKWFAISQYVIFYVGFTAIVLFAWAFFLIAGFELGYERGFEEAMRRCGGCP